MLSSGQQKTLFYPPTTQLNELSQEQLTRQTIIGFIVVAGDGALYGVVQGKQMYVITKFEVQLPRRAQQGHRGVRFARLRQQKRYRYLNKVCEVATQVFISDNKCNVDCLILAGPVDFRNDLQKDERLDQRLSKKIVNNVGVSYGFECGFYAAIEKTLGLWANFKFEIKNIRQLKETPKEVKQNKQVKEDTQEQNILAKQEEKKKMQVDLDSEKQKNTNQIVPE